MSLVTQTNGRLAPDAAAATPSPSRTRAATLSVALSYVTFAVSVVRGIVLVPLYFHFFSLSVYGAWLATASVVSLIGTFDIGLTAVLFQRLAEAYGARDMGRFSRIAGSGAALLMVVPAFALLGIAAAPIVPGLVNADLAVRAPLSLTFSLTAVGTALTLAQSNVMAVSHAWQRTGIGGLSRVVGQICEICGTVVSLFAGAGLVAFGIGALVGGAAGFVVITAAVVRLWRKLGLPRPQFTRTDSRELLRTSLPVFLSRIVGYCASNMEVAVISGLLNPTAAGVYGLTDRLFRFSQGIVNPVAGSVTSALPHLLGEAGMERVRQTTRELFVTWALLVALVLPVLVAMNRDFIGTWVGPDKYGGLGLTVAVCLAMIVYTRCFLLSTVLTAVGEIVRAGYIAAVEPIARLAIMVGGLRLLGPTGVPIGGILGMGLLATIVYPAFLRRRLALSSRESTSLQLSGVGALGLALAISVGLARFLPPVHGWLRVGLKTLACEAAITMCVFAASRAVRAQAFALGKRMRRFNIWR
jgi:O-antigen/teichoic acid export membrane protein